MAERFAPADIRRYYDRHSAAFVRHGQGRASIHRAVWGPGTRTRQDAFHYVDEQVAALVRQQLASAGDVHVVDLGCGVGASLCYVAERLPIRGTGITLSPVQVAMAHDLVAAAGLAERVRCVEGDYCDLPDTVAHANVAFAIESFVHGSDPERLLRACHRVLAPGGVLVICDDMRAPHLPPHAERTIAQFVRGWHINTLVERDTLERMAASAGFAHESTTDLTSMLEINRVRDRIIGLGLATFGWLPPLRERLDYVAGGHALQTCLANRWLRYELSVFRRV
jgi:cyclopropane fatty-acyl-phospholipid synthase-like methyltransferase